MSEQVESKGMMPPQMPMPMVARTFMQRMCELIGMQVSVFLNFGNATAPLTGMLHAVGQDYLELHSGTNSNIQASIIPMWSIGLVTVAGAMQNICPPPTGCPTSPAMGGGMMPGCPMPGGECPPGVMMPGMGPGGMMPGMGPGMGMPGMMDVKDVKKEG